MPKFKDFEFLYMEEPDGTMAVHYSGECDVCGTQVDNRTSTLYITSRNGEVMIRMVCKNASLCIINGAEKERERLAKEKEQVA